MNREIRDTDRVKDCKEEYLLDDVNVKQYCECGEPTEELPLRSDCKDSNMDSKENDANLGEKGGSKDGRNKGLREWLSKSRVKWWIAVLVAVVLLTVVLVGTLLAVEDNDDDFEDTSIRLVKLWPRPNGPKNTINFIHGTLPYEGKMWPELTQQLDFMLASYQPKPNRSRYLIQCYGNMPPKDKVCHFDIKLVGSECSKATNYGYDKGKPCIFFEFNKIVDWIPEAYTTRDLETLPDLPEQVRYFYRPTMVFLDCQGDTLVDQENIGPVKYSPDRGFPIRYFPYRKQPEYMPPLIAVHFANPAVGVAVSVSCKFWAKNINHTDEAIPSGQISFNLLVD